MRLENRLKDIQIALKLADWFSTEEQVDYNADLSLGNNRKKEVELPRTPRLINDDQTTVYHAWDVRPAGYSAPNSDNPESK